MRIAIALVLLAATACTGVRTAASPAASRMSVPALVGIWRVTQVNGHDLPAPSPQEPNVTVERASLMLQANRDYTLSITARTGAQSPAEQAQSGRWSAGDGTITLTPANARPTRFEYTLAEGTLTLREPGIVYTLVRS
ncbi:MAG TPA: lipocalin family protein [Longimicrobiaceae bacterium]